jgi:cytochrome c556
MIRKWLIFAVSAAMLVVAGVVAGPSLSKADDDKESPLEKIMEKVNKNNTIIQKGTRTKVAFAKAQKDVKKSAEDLVKLAKLAKPITDAVKKAKDVPEPQKRWDELIGELIKTSEKLGQVAGKPNAAFQDAKDAFGAVKKVCTDCHKDFRVDETTF